MHGQVIQKKKNIRIEIKQEKTAEFTTFTDIECVTDFIDFERKRT